MILERIDQKHNPKPLLLQQSVSYSIKKLGENVL